MTSFRISDLRWLVTRPKKAEAPEVPGDPPVLDICSIDPDQDWLVHDTLPSADLKKVGESCGRKWTSP
jgi:hypothetical protein